MAEQKDEKAPPVDAKAYYGYLFEADKKPAKVLSALLRGIALYISEHIGDPEQKKLTPDKLAAFYQAVGGNYDSLFVALPPPSISWIYASLGCQHTLQPTPNNDFIPPCIPALTNRGFVRWQSIETLLGPEEHVPFIQSALLNFQIVHPDTGEPFPVDLPATAFPLAPDPEIEKWHKQCAKALRKRATPNEEVGDERARQADPDLPPRPRVSRGQFSHVHPNSEYFDREPKYRSRPQMAYQHVSSASSARPTPMGPGLSHSPPHRARQFLAPEDTQPQRTRRRSFPEEGAPSPAVREPDPYKRPEVVEDHVPVNPHPPMNAGRPDMNARRHSHDHPRRARRGSVSSDASSEESDTSPGHRSRNPHGGHRTAPTSREHSATRDPPNVVRYSMPPPEARPRPRPSNKEDESWKRRSYHGGGILSDIGGKFGFGHKRDNSRGTLPSAGSRDGIRRKDLDSLGGSGDDRGNGSGRERRRDGVPMDRRSLSYRARDREREREHDRDRHSGGDRERPYSGADRDPDRERANTGDRSSRYTSPIRGVDGRRYPSGH